MLSNLYLNIVSFHERIDCGAYINYADISEVYIINKKKKASNDTPTNNILARLLTRENRHKMTFLFPIWIFVTLVEL